MLVLLFPLKESKLLQTSKTKFILKYIKSLTKKQDYKSPTVLHLNIITVSS